MDIKAACGNPKFQEPFKAIIVCLLFTLILTAPVSAQTENSKDDVEKMEQVLNQLDDDQVGGEDMMLPESPGSIALDEETRAAYLKSLRQYYSYRATGLEHRRSVFQWQLFSAKVIFVAVLALVGLGMYFAAVQFSVDMGKIRNSKDGVAETAETQVELNPTGIKVTSPVLGVVILALSLGFFYLYLVYVYPIEDIF